MRAIVRDSFQSRPHASDIEITVPALIVLMGGAASGKSSFAARSFRATEAVSSDRCRALVGDSEEIQAYSKQAFELFYFLIEKRMELDKVVVADSTALQPSVRGELLSLARRHYYPAILIVFDVPLGRRRELNLRRERVVEDQVLVAHQEAFEVARDRVLHEPWDAIFFLESADVDTASVRLHPPGVESSAEPPYDIVGDVHGCYDELMELLGRLGWQRRGAELEHPEGRTAVFVGDIGDRGPNVPACIDVVTRLAASSRALFVPGNHDNKLMRHLRGRRVTVRYGLERTLEQLDALEPALREDLVERFLKLMSSSPPYYLLDRRRLVVAHGGLREGMIGKVSDRIARFALYGDTIGRTLESGLPERRDWAATYRGRQLIVYGHTPAPEPVLRNNTLNVDQGCVFGGRLTALRYPEMEVVQVAARQQYAPWPGRPHGAPSPGGTP